MSAKFESSLERDFFVLLEFNNDVLRWDAQPVRLSLGPGLGSYVPDVLVTYLNSSAISDTRHVLYEVKYRDELRRNWATLRPRYRVATRFARSHGWRFRIVTEVEIRTQLLWNAKFLLPYLEDMPQDDDWKRLNDALRSVEESTPAKLLKMCSVDRLIQAKLVNTLWYMVANRHVSLDLTRKLTMNSPIWIDV